MAGVHRRDADPGCVGSLRRVSDPADLLIVGGRVFVAYRPSGPVPYLWKGGRKVHDSL